MATQKTDKQLFTALLGSKDLVAMIRLSAQTDLSLDIEVASEVTEVVDKDVKPSYYSVKLYVADIVIAESKKFKSPSSAAKLELKESNPVSVVF